MHYKSNDVPVAIAWNRKFQLKHKKDLGSFVIECQKCSILYVQIVNRGKNLNICRYLVFNNQYLEFLYCGLMKKQLKIKIASWPGLQYHIVLSINKLMRFVHHLKVIVKRIIFIQFYISPIKHRTSPTCKIVWYFIRCIPSYKNELVF